LPRNDNITMKLTTFQSKKDQKIYFGVLIHEIIVSFDVLQQKCGVQYKELTDVYSYLNALPESETKAKELYEYGLKHAVEEGLHLDDVCFLSPIPKPPMLLDFTLSPRHLKNSLNTLLKHEFTPLKRALINFIAQGKLKKQTHRNSFPYYKGNHVEIIGDGEETHWPDYTAYLDFEPELAFVVGNEQVPIAGYLIFNDWSARDIQWPELSQVSLTRTKDFTKSNGLGPFLVTPDEVGNPLDLKVRASVEERIYWEGTTSEYAHHPEEVVKYMKTIFSPQVGSVIGMGTVPGCCGLDNDEWIKPGENIKISIEKLGVLHQKVPKKKVNYDLSRWKKR